jgi:cellulose biosynthesis protein BcsQ
VANSNLAITAIRNTTIENFVAATLDQIGWTLLFRAMSIEALGDAVRLHPDAVIIAAEDFGIERNSISNPLIILESGQELTGFALHELLRRINDIDTSQTPTIARCTSNVTVIATVDSGIGGSTVAMNIAHENSRLGRKTLLLDFNSVSPVLARYFDVQRINRKISPTQFGFSLGEASEISFLGEIAREAEDFDQVVIDLGTLPSTEHLVSGVRIHEVAARWSLQSASTINLVARSDADSLNRLKVFAPYLLQQLQVPLPKILLVSHSPLSPRNARAIKASAAEIFGGEVRQLPRDARAIERATLERVPLMKSAPKSPLARELASMVVPLHQRGR